MGEMRENNEFKNYLEKLNSEIEKAIEEAVRIPVKRKPGVGLSFNKIVFVYLKYH